MTIDVSSRRDVLKILAAGSAALGLQGLAPSALAQAAFPSRSVRLVVPFPAGGTTDVIGRLIAQELGKVWGQQVVVDNRVGGNGIVGTKFVSESEPNGYTLVMAIDSSQITAGLLNPPAAYHPVNDFSPIASLARGQFILLAHPSLGVSSVKELVDYAKKNPGKINAGSSGVGTTPHLCLEMLKVAAGLDIVHVPYNGSAPAMLAQLAGEVQISFVSAPLATKELSSGKSALKALMTPSQRRWPLLPDVPTSVEAGYPDVQDESMFGLLAPAKTPQAVVDKINADVRKALQTPEMEKRMLDLGYAISISSPAEYGKILTENYERKRKIVAQAKITAN